MLPVPTASPEDLSNSILPQADTEETKGHLQSPSH